MFTLAYCGLRCAEAAALRVRDVDLLRRRLSVVRAVAEVGGRFVVGAPKAHHHRSVPIPAFLADELASEFAGRGADDLAFPAPKGGMLRNLTFRRGWFDQAAAEIGLAGLTPHELRHTAASLAVSAGATVKAVQRMLGHASAAMTLGVYAGPFSDDLDVVADRMHKAKVASDADFLRTKRGPGVVWMITEAGSQGIELRE